MINISDITINYGNEIVIENLSLKINKGELLVLTGRAGSGKTTLLKSIAGLMPTNSGNILINNKNITEYNKKEMLNYYTNTGFVFQNSALISNITLWDNLALYYKYHTNLSDDEIMNKITPYLDYVEFSGNLNLRPSTSSVGEKMLINIIRAISADQELILWDEPIAKIDQITSQKVEKIIQDLKESKKTMILTTHNMKFASTVADRIAILHDGKIYKTGTYFELMQEDDDLIKNYLELN